MKLENVLSPPVFYHWTVGLVVNYLSLDLSWFTPKI